VVTSGYFERVLRKGRARHGVPWPAY